MIKQAVLAIQRELLARGYDLGRTGADGVMGNKTRDALKQFQAAQGLPVTGLADVGTTQALSQSAATPPNPRLRPPPAEVMSGGRPSPSQGVPPTPQMRPGDNQPPVALGQGLTGPAAMMPRLRPGVVTAATSPSGLLPDATPGMLSQPLVPPINPASDDAAFAGMRTASAPNMRNGSPGMQMPPEQANRFAPPPPDVLARLNATTGDQAASAMWRHSLPSEMNGIQTGGMGMPGLPQMGFGNSPGRTNQAPLSGQGGPRGTPMPAPPTPDQIAAAKAALAAKLQAMQQPQTAQAQPAFTPTPDNPGIGLPGLPPSPDLPSALNSAAAAAAGAAQQLFGVQPAYGDQAPAVPSTPSPNLPLAWAPGGLQGMQMAAAKAKFRDALWKALLGARIQQTYGPGVTSTLSAPASPPGLPLRYP